MRDLEGAFCGFIQSLQVNVGQFLHSSRTLHGTQYTYHSLKYLLLQRRMSYSDVFLLISSTIL